MATFNYKRARRSAYNQIKRWGGAQGSKAKLVRAGVQRACVAARLEFTPRERGLYEDGVSKFYVAALGLAVAPDNEQDEFLFDGKLYRIIQPVSGIRQSDAETLFYELIVVFSRVA